MTIDKIYQLKCDWLRNCHFFITVQKLDRLNFLNKYTIDLTELEKATLHK